jgi:hypothetical protein
VLLLDRLLTTPTTTKFDAVLAASQRADPQTPSMASFLRAERALVAGSILRDLGTGGEVSWHRKAVRTAYAAMQASQRYRTIRDGKAT